MPKKKKTFTSRPGPKRVYWPNCSVCQYMKKNPDYRRRVMLSTYFNPSGRESLMDINKSFNMPFKTLTLYAHMRRHQADDLIKAKDAFDTAGSAIADAVGNTVRMIEEPIDDRPKTNHEMGLDEVISAGRDKLLRGELHITATTLLQAIKIKSDNEKGNKDRRLEALKTMFKGAAPKQQESLDE